MIKSDNIPEPEANGFFNHLGLPPEKRPVFGNFSKKVYDIDNLEDYLNFSWKFDTSCLSDIQDKFTWLDNTSDVFSVDLDDKLTTHYDSTIIGLSTLETKLEEYLYGSSYNRNGTPDHSSWNIPDSHPLKVSMIFPGDEKFPLNTNWNERLQSSFRNFWFFNNFNKLSEFTNEHEYDLLREVGNFAKSCKLKAAELLFSLLSSNLAEVPCGFIEVTPNNYPLIYKFHSPKFQNDRMFLNDGIVFTLVLGNTSYSKMSYTISKKFYSNDFKGKQALCDSIHSLSVHSRFALPFYCITDYMGFRVVSEPLLPISKTTKYLLDDLLGLDSTSVEHDGHLISSSLFSNDELYKDFIKLSNYLRVTSWPLPFGSSDLVGPQDFNNDCNAIDLNGSLYFRNTHEVLPPFPHPNSGSNQFYVQRFRQEFSTHFYKGPLKCSFNCQSLFDKDYDDTMFEKARDHNNFLIENNIDKFHTITGSWDISNTLHSFGINIKNIGKIYENSSHSSLKDVLACEMAARAFKHLWDLEVEKLITSENLYMGLIETLFLKMLNDFLGLTLDSSAFWYQNIHPQISIHFNVINFQDFSFKRLPQMLLVCAVEYNMGIVLPKLEHGKKYTSEIQMNEFKNTNSYSIYNSPNHKSPFYPKVSVTCPKYTLSLFKASYKLCDHKDLFGYGFLLDSCSFGMGLPRHVKSKIFGTGYPCDPICVYNLDLICSNFSHHLTGTNLYCLIESLIQTDPVLRFKLLLTLGYSFLKHGFYNKALIISEFLTKNSFGTTLFIESKILELQCHILGGDYESMEADYVVLINNLKNLESFDGFLNIQLLIVMCYDAWNRKDYKLCKTRIESAKESFLHLFSVKSYEWVPVFFMSLLGYCNKELNVYFDSTKIHHELLRHCNFSNLPTHTKCNMLWLLLESLIRVGSYSHACKISNDLASTMEFEFGHLSMEYLRSLYVSAWIHRQIGSIHFIHPYLYLSNSDKLLYYKGQDYWFENHDLIMEELSSANNCLEKRNHLKDSLSLYTTLLDKFLYLSRENKIKLLEVVSNIDPDYCTYKLEKLVNITRERLMEQGNQTILDNIDDSFLNIYLTQAGVFQDKLMLVIENFLKLKILSMDTNQCNAVANKLYNAYASQVSSEYTKKISTGPIPEKEVFHVKPKTSYGSKLLRKSESFSSQVKIRKNIIPRSGHELRSVEYLLMGEPEYSKNDICEMCLSCCDCGTDFNSWFDSVFDFIHPKCILSGDKFLLSLDILRNFSTPCLRLFILGHLAYISGSDLNQTITFKLFKKNMSNSRNNKTNFE